MKSQAESVRIGWSMPLLLAAVFYFLAVGAAFAEPPAEPATEPAGKPATNTSAEDASETQVRAVSPSEGVVPGRAGSRAFIDPETGRLTTPPPTKSAEGTPLDLELREALRTDDTGLVSVQSPIPGGGVEMDLEDRFRSTVFATLDGDGSIVLSHEMPKAFLQNLDDEEPAADEAAGGAKEGGIR